jgi:16S rRNA (guanine966-N2)-methyltransferase
VPRREPPKRPNNRAKSPRHTGDKGNTEVAGLRIIGGRFRGRKLSYSGDLRTRPMKDRLREAVFNLVGTDARDALAIDLFAGTGALGLEALSRGARQAIFLEQHFPTAAIINQNATALAVADSCEVVPGNTFIWFRRFGQSLAEKKGTGAFCRNAPQGALHKMCLSPFFRPEDAATRHWLVFCSPPYDFYVERQAEMLELINGMIDAAPPKSVFVVEADERFDFQSLPLPDAWDVRRYPPAVVGIMRKAASDLIETSET